LKKGRIFSANGAVNGEKAKRCLAVPTTKEVMKEVKKEVRK